jgi:hypothetical protein
MGYFFEGIIYELFLRKNMLGYILSDFLQSHPVTLVPTA